MCTHIVMNLDTLAHFCKYFISVKRHALPPFVVCKHGLVPCVLLWSRRLLVRDELEAIRALLIVGQHDGDAIGKRLVLQGEGESRAAFVRPSRTDARPDFLPTLVFAGRLAV